MPVTLIDESQLIGIVVFGAVGWVAAVAVSVFLLAGLGKEPLKLAALLASCRRRGTLCALVRIGRSIRASAAVPLHGNMWMFRIGGRSGLAYVSSDAIYRLAGTDVFLVSVNNAAALTVKDLEALAQLDDREQRRIVSTVVANLEGPVSQRLLQLADEYASRGGDEDVKAAELLRAAVEEIAVKARTLVKLEEVVDFLEQLKRKYGVEVKQLLPASVALDLAMVDALIERRTLNPRELLVLAASQVKAIEEVVGRMGKKQQGAPLAVLVIILALAAAAMLFLLR